MRWLKHFEGYLDKYYSRIGWTEWRSEFENKFLQMDYRQLVKIAETLDRLGCPWSISLCLEKPKGGIRHVYIKNISDLKSKKEVIDNLKPYEWNNLSPSSHFYFYPYEDLRSGSYQTIEMGSDDWFIIRYDRYVVDGVGKHIADDGRRMYHDLEIWKCDQMAGLVKCLEFLIGTKDQIIKKDI